MAGMGSLALLGPHQETDALGVSLPEAGQATHRHGRIATQFGAQDLGDLRQGYRGLKVPFHEVLCSPEMLEGPTGPSGMVRPPAFVQAERTAPQDAVTRCGQVHHTWPAGRARAVGSKGEQPWG